VDSLISAANSYEGQKIIQLCIEGVDEDDGDQLELYFLKRLSDLRRIEQINFTGDDESNPRFLHALVGTVITGVQSLSLDGLLYFEKDIVTLATAPPALWASLEFLHIGGCNGEHGDTLSVADVVHTASPHLSRLRKLCITNSTVRAHGALLLERAASQLPKLQAFRLEKIRFEGDHAAVSLLRAVLSESLEELGLYSSHIKSAGAQMLVAAAAGLPRLRRFELSCVDAGMDGGLAIVHAALEHWPLLETLELENVPLDIRAARVLGSTSQLSHLKKLSLGFNGFQSEGVAALLGGGAAWLGTVESLDLRAIFWGVPWRELEQEGGGGACIISPACCSPGPGQRVPNTV
jgi:hypothetical protein